MTWRLEPDEDIAAAFPRIAREELAKVRDELIADGRDRDAGIHQARRSFKKLRALARLARPALGKSFQQENKRWRDAGRLLSDTRDAAVLAQTFDRIVERSGLDLSSSHVAALRAAVMGDGAAAPSDRHPPPVVEVLKRVETAEQEVPQLGWPETEKEVLRGLRDAQDKLRRSWTTARTDESSAALHEWRKRVKDFSAQISLFKYALPPELKQSRRHARELAEILGEEHDLCMLAEKLSTVAATSEAEALRSQLQAEIPCRREELRLRAFELGDGLSRRKGKVLTKELSESWNRARTVSLRRTRTEPSRPETGE